MARWGRRGLNWYISQWLDGREQRPTPYSTGWAKRKWLEQPKPLVRKSKPSYGMFKAKKATRPIRNRSAVAFSTERKDAVQGFKLNRLSKPANTGKRSVWKRVVILFLIGLLAIIIPAFVFVEKNIREPLMHVAKIRVKQVATQAINGAVTEQVAQRVASESLIDWKMDSNGKISGFMLNYNEHMRITSSTIETVQGTLTDLQHMPERIPLGHALDSAIISTYGPKIPVSFEPLGAVKVELNTREKNAAINMVLVEVYIKVITEVAIIIPFDMEPEIVETEIPISYLLVVGDVPMYYYDSKGQPIGESAPQAPNISVPLQQGQGVSSGSAEQKEEAHGTEKGLNELEKQPEGKGLLMTP